MANISIVDTDQDNIDSITAGFRGESHKLTFFTSSAALMQSLQKKRSDMIILGVEVDAEDGRAISKMLQTESVYKDIPVILLSPFYHTEQEVRSFYCDDLLSVPFDAAALNNSVNGLLSKEQSKTASKQEVAN